MPLKNIVILALSLLLLIFLGATRSTAIASSNLSGRVLRLESDLLQMRSQLNRLDAEVARQSRRLESQRLASQRLESQTVASPPSSPRPQPSEPTPEEQFDRLATLAIELKQQLEQLEARVVRLESQ